MKTVIKPLVFMSCFLYSVFGISCLTSEYITRNDPTMTQINRVVDQTSCEVQLTHEFVIAHTGAE